jgi:hypothetical protein
MKQVEIFNKFVEMSDKETALAENARYKSDRGDLVVEMKHLARAEAYARAAQLVAKSIKEEMDKL